MTSHVPRRYCNSPDDSAVKPPAPTIKGVDPVVTEPWQPGKSLDVVTVPYGLAEAKIECVVGPSKPAFDVIKW